MFSRKRVVHSDRLTVCHKRRNVDWKIETCMEYVKIRTCMECIHMYKKKKEKLFYNFKVLPFCVVCYRVLIYFQKTALKNDEVSGNSLEKRRSLRKGNIGKKI